MTEPGPLPAALVWGYPPRLFAFAASVILLAVPVTAGAVLRVALDPPGLTTILGIVLFFVLALLAELKPVPLDEEGMRIVSLAFIFILAAEMLFGWELAALASIVAIVVAQRVERAPHLKAFFNAAVYGIAAFAAALPTTLLLEGTGGELASGRTTIASFVAGAVFVAVNIGLVCRVIAIAEGRRLAATIRDHLRHSGPAFVIMAFIAALAVSLWAVEQWLVVLLAGPLFTLALYQRYALSTRLATRAAHTDSLTGLSNHRSYQVDLRARVDGACAERTPVSLCLLDVDSFKAVNDRFGHPVGDEVLSALGKLLVEAESPRVAAYRIGGDEFALLVEGGAGAAVEITSALRRRVRETSPSHGEVLTVSVGIASYPLHADTVDRLQQVADRALYWAKWNGKDRSCVYGPSVRRVSPTEVFVNAERRARLRAAKNLIRAVDAKDTYTGSHSHAVAELAERLARELGLDDETVEQVRLAGLLHDLGKITVSDPILRKPTSLTAAESAELRTHPERGFALLDGLTISPIDTWVLHHHEHWDGSGYPAGLAGEEIPLGSRIVLVADAFEAMTTDRTYRDAITVEAALAELELNAWRQFDGSIVAALRRAIGTERVAIALAPAV